MSGGSDLGPVTADIGRFSWEFLDRLSPQLKPLLEGTLGGRGQYCCCAGRRNWLVRCGVWAGRYGWAWAWAWVRPGGGARRGSLPLVGGAVGGWLALGDGGAVLGAVWGWGCGGERLAARGGTRAQQWG